MKQVVKGQEPAALREWREANAGIPENLRYNCGRWPSTDIKAALMREQGYLCAYTMKRIPGNEDCHIEHVVSRDQCHREWPEGEVDYRNLVACYPGKGGCAYGAKQKDNHPIDNANFVSPLSADVEQRFSYSSNGSISADVSDGAACSTIRILKLDHDDLVELRRAAINEAVLDADLDLSDLQVLAARIMEPNSNGECAEFCLAISQVASQWPPPTNPR